MNKYFCFFLLITVACLPLISNAQEADTTAIKSEIINRFKTLDVSYLGTTQNCIPYDVYALKYYNSWILAVIENQTVGIFVTRPPRSKERIHTASLYFMEGTSKLIELKNYLKKKSRRKVVNDLELYGFYKLNKLGKRTARGLLLLELPDNRQQAEPSFFLFKFFHNLFSKTKLPENDRIKPNLEEKIQPIEDKLNEQLDTIK